RWSGTEGRTLGVAADSNHGAEQVPPDKSAFRKVASIESPDSTNGEYSPSVELSDISPPRRPPVTPSAEHYIVSPWTGRCPDGILQTRAAKSQTVARLSVFAPVAANTCNERWEPVRRRADPFKQQNAPGRSVFCTDRGGRKQTFMAPHETASTEVDAVGFTGS